VRLRFINGSAMGHFDVRIPALKITVVGRGRAGASGDRRRISIVETLDISVEIVEPDEPPRDMRAWRRPSPTWIVADTTCPA